MISEISESGVSIRRKESSGKRYRKVAELARATGWSRNYVQAMKKVGLRLPASVEEAEQFLIDHPGFRMSDVFKVKRYDEAALAVRLKCTKDVVKEMRRRGLVFTHGSTTILSPVLDWLEANPEFQSKVSFARGRWQRAKKETTHRV